MNRAVFLFYLFLSSCSTLKKSLIYSGSSGLVAGSIAGANLSPNKESRVINAVVFGLIGAGIAGGTGYLLYKDDPRNYKLNNMLISGKPEVIEFDLETIKINMGLNKQEAYQVPLKNLPKELKGKVSKQFIIKHKSNEQYLQKGKKTYYIPSFSIYEHSYSSPVGSETGKQDGQ